MFHIQANSGEPIYRQLVEQIRRMVAGGQLQPGDELPSVRELASEHAINPMTISKAYSLLETEGLLLRQRGRPMAVAAQTQVSHSDAARLQQLQPQLQALIQASQQLQLSQEQVQQELLRLWPQQ